MEEVCANDSNPVFNLTKAVKAVQNGMKVSHAASKYSIPASILFNRISAIRHKKKMSGQPTNLSPESHSIVNSENLSPESHSIANSEEPDEYGILVNDKKYNCKAKPPFNSVYVSEILAVALRLVLQGQTTTKEAASLYGIKHKTLNRKLRHIKRIQIKKLGSNPVQLPMALKKLKCYRQRNSSSPYPQLSASNSILNTMKRMTMMNGLTFPQPLYDCIVKLEQGVDFREMIHYYSLNMRVTVKVIRFLKRAKKSSRVWCGIISNKIEDLLPQISAPDSTPSSPRNSLTPSQTTNQSLASPSASQSYTTQDLSKACELIRNGESIKGAALKFHIPYTTLYNYQKLDSQKKKDQQEAVKFSERKGSPSPSMSSSPSSSSALTGNLEGLAGKLVGGMKQSQVSESQKGKSSKSLLCLFCHGKTGNEVELGKLHILNQVVVHYFCLLFSSALEQNGEDDEGILGFLPKDILKELNRGKKLKCVHCGEKGATIGCYSKNCKRTYHFPCGLKHHAQFVFTDNFRSVCSKHRKFQTGNNRGEEVECPICLQFMVADPKYAVWSPCCQKSSWFHKLCIQKLALNAGYFFKCPLCNDKSTFVPEMLQQGIYVPEQDASWELEPNAYHELLERPIRCDAPTCTCPSGRKNDEEGTNWEVVLCNLCGSTGVHVSCGKLRRAQPEWNCHTCTAMLHESALRAEQEKRDRYRRNRTTFESDDESEDEVSFTPSKRRRLQSPSQSSVAVRLKYCSSYDQDVDVGSDSDSNGKESASDSARPSSSSLSCRMAEVGSDNEEVFVPRGIRGDVVIADLVAQGLTPLSDALKELQDYAEGLPLKLVKSRFDETTFLHSLNEYSSSETSEQPVAYTVTKDHLRRFVRCTFTYDQMRLLRKVFELCFIINAIKTKISRYQKDVRNDPFKKRARNSFLMKKMKCLQNHLINLLTQAKTVNLLEGDSTWTRLASSAINHKPLDVKTDADPPNQTMSTSSAAASTHNDEPSTSSTVRYIRQIKIQSLNENCAWCNMQLMPGVMPTTVVLSQGHLEVICVSCSTLNIFCNLFPKVPSSLEKSVSSLEKSVSSSDDYNCPETNEIKDHEEALPSSEVIEEAPQPSPGKGNKKQMSLLSYFESRSTRANQSQKEEKSEPPSESNDKVREPCSPEKLPSLMETEAKDTTAVESLQKPTAQDDVPKNKEKSVESTSTSTKQKSSCEDLIKYRYHNPNKGNTITMPPESIIQSLCRPPTHTAIAITRPNSKECQTCFVMGLAREKPLSIYCPCCNSIPNFCSKEHFTEWHSFTHNWMLIPTMHGNNRPQMICKVCPEQNYTRFFCPACPIDTGLCSRQHYQWIHENAPHGSQDGQANLEKVKERKNTFSSYRPPSDSPTNTASLTGERNSWKPPFAQNMPNDAVCSSLKSSSTQPSADGNPPSEKALLKHFRMRKLRDNMNILVIGQQTAAFPTNEGEKNESSGHGNRTNESISTSRQQDDSPNLQTAIAAANVGNQTTSGGIPQDKSCLEDSAPPLDRKKDEDTFS